ncbi:MAG: coenzyme F420-reducing hydrogenase subunit alpha [Candidatus Berkelbacteria bacterium Licking1014_2]|uniref:Coenzyme F420-reducing hydrogenase subunit alpha n=1 Tax=Candidatus Berkelbacteria bacterium Licking1014_2 TaxID=2017146 RepID=A0A554LY00_9BACT|nr:MAG: coenzyme F420-reducing hydrogenase subunit alpha [Candidatus Berkelbacteria bacterium Licking1014_2]
MKQLIPDYITKIEGHGVIKVDFNHATAKLEVAEGERLFEGLLLNQPAQQAIYLTSRICGVCPIAHQLAAAKALEAAAGLKINSTDQSLRQLLHANQIISSHLIHLFFLALPDFSNDDSSLDLAAKYPAEFHLVLNLKRLVDQINQLVGGGTVHPTTIAVGGLNRHPAPTQISQIKDTIEEVLDEATDFARLFANLPYPRLQRNCELFCLDDNENYSFDGGDVIGSRGSRWLASDYANCRLARAWGRWKRRGAFSIIIILLIKKEKSATPISSPQPSKT